MAKLAVFGGQCYKKCMFTKRMDHNILKSTPSFDMLFSNAYILYRNTNKYIKIQLCNHLFLEEPYQIGVYLKVLRTKTKITVNWKEKVFMKNSMKNVCRYQTGCGNTYEHTYMLICNLMSIWLRLARVTKQTHL